MDRAVNVMLRKHLFDTEKAQIIADVLLNEIVRLNKEINQCKGVMATINSVLADMEPFNVHEYGKTVDFADQIFEKLNVMFTPQKQRL